MIEFVVKKCLVPVEIYSVVVNVFGNSGPSKTMICKWELKFKCDRTTLKMITTVEAQKEQLQISLKNFIHSVESRILSMDGIAEKHECAYHMSKTLCKVGVLHFVLLHLYSLQASSSVFQSKDSITAQCLTLSIFKNML